MRRKRFHRLMHSAYATRGRGRIRGEIGGRKTVALDRGDVCPADDRGSNREQPGAGIQLDNDLSHVNVRRTRATRSLNRKRLA
jgi:hypothetical protein